MNPSEELEPGLLPTFRLFIGIQLALIVLGVGAHWVIALFPPQPGMPVFAVFSILELGLLFLYLSLPVLQRRLKSWYLPLGIVWAAASPILDPYLNVYSPGNHTPEILAQVVLWRQIILLMIPLVVLSWQYTMHQVVLFCVLAAVVNIALLSHGLAWQQMISHSLLGIILVQTIIFLLVGQMIVKLMNVQREQRYRLTEAHARLAQYASALEQLTVSRERNRLARELHDVLAHTLSGVAVELEGLRALLRPDPERANALLNHSLQAIRDGLVETRRALKELRAKPLEDLGLGLAIQVLADSYARRYDFCIDLSIDPDLDDYPAEVQQCVYRITQEALANIAEHAQAQHAHVILKREGAGRPRSERDQLRLIICDDGCGFDPRLAKEENQYGLQGMRERAAMIRASLAVESQVGQGTQISLSYGGDQ